MIPPIRRWWPGLGLFGFLWIVPAALGFSAFGCHDEEPEVPAVPDTPPTEEYQALSSAAPSGTSFTWIGIFVPLLAGAGLVVGRLRGRDS